MGRGEQKMGSSMKNYAIVLSEAEVMELQGILMDRDAEQALRFLKKVLASKIKAQGAKEFDFSRGTGIGI